MSVRRDYIVFKYSPSCLKGWLNGVLDGRIWSPLIRILTICASNEHLETRFLIVWNIFCSWKIFIECLNAQQSKTKGVLPLERWFSRRTLARLEVSCLPTSSYKTLVFCIWLVERVTQVIWTNHRAKWGKTKAIPCYFQYNYIWTTP